MKTGNFLARIIVVPLIVLSARAQGTFQNLNFESEQVSPSTHFGTFVPVSQTLPGWSAYFTSPTFGTQPQTQVAYDGISTGGNVIALIDARAYPPIQGNYSAFLFGGEGVSATISQTGTIPSGTESVFMSAWSSGASPIVAVNRQIISMQPVQVFANYTLYGGAISAFAGEPGTLSFTEPSPQVGSPSFFLLDNIAFSPTATPEPSTLGLMLTGGVKLGLRYWRGRKQ